MSDEENTAAPPAPLPVIESGMRTGQGDESDDADTLTIGGTHTGDAHPAPDPATDPHGAAESVHEAAAVLGDPDYRLADEENTGF